MARSAVQSQKQSVGTAVRLAGSVTLVKLAQLRNAPLPRLVTESGSTIAVSPDPKNAPEPMVVTVFGTAMVRSAEQVWKQEFGTAGRLARSVTLAKLSQPRNTLVLRLVTESGSTIDVSPAR